MAAVLGHWMDFLSGIGFTLGLVALGWIGALVLGTLLALMRIGPIRLTRSIATVYVLVFRNIPIPVQMVLFVFGLPLVGIKLPLFPSAAIVLVIYHAAFVCETLRAGVNAIPAGEVEAMRAVGFGTFGVMRDLVIPQAFAAVVQPLGNVLVLLVKNTSVAAIVGVTELTFVADQVAVEEVQTLVVFGGAALAYVILCVALKRVVSVVGRQYRVAR